MRGWCYTQARLFRSIYLNTAGRVIVQRRGGGPWRDPDAPRSLAIDCSYARLGARFRRAGHRSDCAMGAASREYVYFSIRRASEESCCRFVAAYPLGTPVALVHRVSWRDERIHRSTLGKLLSEVRAKDWQLTTLLLIGETLEERPGVESSLYAARFTHRFRRAAVRRRRIG